MIRTSENKTSLLIVAAWSAFLLLGVAAPNEAKAAEAVGRSEKPFSANVQLAQALAKAKPIPPTPKQAIRLLLANGAISLVGNASCASVKQPGDNNLADYLSSVLATQTDPTILWRTEVKSILVKNRWQVDVRFFGKDPSDVYDMGIRFVTNTAKSTIDPKSISCIGTS